MKEKLLAVGLLIGAAVAPPAIEAAAQAQVPKTAPSPAPKPAAPAPKPAGTPAPRAGGFPMELALPLLGTGAAALGGGVYLLRRNRARE